MKDGFALSLLLLIFHVGGQLNAQQNVQPQTNAASDAPAYRLKTSVNRVLVDVTVTDAHGNPIHDLGKDDFVVEEDGAPQRVLSFDAYNFDKGMDYVPPKIPALSPDTFVNLPPDPERGPLYVLFYDLVNIPIGDQIPARAQLVKFIENKPAGARMAILVSSDDMHLVQGFTSDQRKLLAAVDLNGTGPHVPKVFMMGKNFGEGDKLAASGRLNSIAEYLAPIAGRKVLIWFASEFPLSLFPSRDETEQYQTVARKTLDLFADDQIALYTVDVSGVVVAESYGAPGAAGEVSGGGALTSDDRDNGIQVSGNSITNHTSVSKITDKGPPKGPGYSEGYGSQMTQDAIAQMTGGKALYSSNNLAGSLEKATEEAGNYYTLGYSPSNKDFDGHLRHIKVTLKDGKDQLAYRRAYYGVPAEAPKALVDDELSASMKHGAPEFHQLVFEAHVTPNGSPARGTKEQMENIAKAQNSARALKAIQLQAYTIDYAVMAKQFQAAGDANPQFEFAAAAYDSDGRLLNSVVNTTIKSETDESANAKSVYRVEQQLGAPAEAKFMRLAVRDVRTGRLGAMEIPLPLTPAK